MDRIWAPWRIQFILGKSACETGEVQESGCIFCTMPAACQDASNFILEQGKNCFTILNLYPYNNGHMMVVPYKHTANIDDIDAETMLEMMQTATRMIGIMRETMNPHGFNLGMNLGDVAGAGIKDHLHLHIVPRWNGDANFMPVIGDTRVISEHIESTYNRLLDALKRQGK